MESAHIGRQPAYVHNAFQLESAPIVGNIMSFIIKEIIAYTHLAIYNDVTINPFLSTYIAIYLL